MKQNKTIAEYEAEIKQLEAAMELPGVTAEESAIYQKTINTITGFIAAKNQQNNVNTKPQPARQRAVQPTQAPPADNTPIPVRVIKAGAPTRAHAPIQQPSEQPAVTITANLSGGAKSVTIDWGHQKTETLTEGEARSRFTTAMRDLTKSRMVKQERFADLPHYITYSRAVAYYRALSQFWTMPPSPMQLEIHPLGRTRQIIFNMIAETANVTTNQSQS